MKSWPSILPLSTSSSRQAEQGRGVVDSSGGIGIFGRFVRSLLSFPSTTTITKVRANDLFASIADTLANERLALTAAALPQWFRPAALLPMAQFNLMGHNSAAVSSANIYTNFGGYGDCTKEDNSFTKMLMETSVERPASQAIGVPVLSSDAAAAAAAAYSQKRSLSVPDFLDFFTGTIFSFIKPGKVDNNNTSPQPFAASSYPTTPVFKQMNNNNNNSLWGGDRFAANMLGQKYKGDEVYLDIDPKLSASMFKMVTEQQQQQQSQQHLTMSHPSLLQSSNTDCSKDFWSMFVDKLAPPTSSRSDMIMRITTTLHAVDLGSDNVNELNDEKEQVVEEDVPLAAVVMIDENNLKNGEAETTTAAKMKSCPRRKFTPPPPPPTVLVVDTQEIQDRLQNDRIRRKKKKRSHKRRRRSAHKMSSCCPDATVKAQNETNGHVVAGKDDCCEPIELEIEFSSSEPSSSSNNSQDNEEEDDWDDWDEDEDDGDNEANEQLMKMFSCGMMISNFGANKTNGSSKACPSSTTVVVAPLVTASISVTAAVPLPHTSKQSTLMVDNSPDMFGSPMSDYSDYEEEDRKQKEEERKKMEALLKKKNEEWELAFADFTENEEGDEDVIFSMEEDACDGGQINRKVRFLDIPVVYVLEDEGEDRRTDMEILRMMSRRSLRGTDQDSDLEDDGK